MQMTQFACVLYIVRVKMTFAPDIMVTYPAQTEVIRFDRMVYDDLQELSKEEKK